MDDLDDVIAEFLVESNENLDALDQSLVALEQNPDPAEIGRIFRAIHTIKGTSGFLGLGTLERLTHAGENLLSRLRDGERPVTTATTTALLAMVEDELDEALVDDAVGELANIVAGNIKGMLVEACKLGLPTVIRGSDYRVSVPGTSVVLEAAFECEGERFTVAVQSPNALPTVG
jgi:two-component system chemotaxis sensor kinase CheA